MLYNGYTTNAVLNYTSDADGTKPAVTVTVNYNTINGFTKNIPVLMPYGFLSIPDDSKTCGYNGVGNFNASMVTGYTNQLAKTSNIGAGTQPLAKGESCLFSKGNYVFKVKNDRLWVTFTNESNTLIETRVAIDENVNIILIDTIAEIAALEAAYNALVATFNAFNATFQAHVHSGVTPGSPTQFSGGTTTPFPTNPTYIATANFTRDQTFINQSPSQMFVNDDGELIS